MTRITELDALRGFSLLGIVLGNVMWFSGVAVSGASAGWLDGAVKFALTVVVDGKFYALFSLLFGASFSLLVQRQRQRGRSGGSIVAARLGALFGLGLAHASLLWFGDILSLYAVAAIPLYWLLGRSDRALLRWAIGLLAAPVAISLGLFIVLPGEAAALGYGPAALLPSFGSGSYSELLLANAAFLKQRWVLALASGRLLRLLGMFALGALLLRSRSSPTRRGHVALWVAAAGGNLVLGFWSAAPPPSSILAVAREAIVSVAVPTGCLAYVSLLWPRLGRRGPITSALAAAGRLSLTHYLAQSLVLATVFYGCGLGLWGRFDAGEAVAFAGALVVLQIAASRVWFRRFGIGPGERLLRLFDVLLSRASSARSVGKAPSRQ